MPDVAAGLCTSIRQERDVPRQDRGASGVVYWRCPLLVSVSRRCLGARGLSGTPKMQGNLVWIDRKKPLKTRRLRDELRRPRKADCGEYIVVLTLQILIVRAPVQVCPG